ncbi:hypothetical protein BsWGS_24645 [Bradybaena similaris]
MLDCRGCLQVYRLGDKGRFARAVAAQCKGWNFIFTADGKSRPYLGSNAGHMKYELDDLIPLQPSGISPVPWRTYLVLRCSLCDLWDETEPLMEVSGGSESNPIILNPKI